MPGFPSGRFSMTDNVAKTCPWCNAPREGGDSCPKCGANYLKAELIRKQGRAVAVAPAAVAAAAPVTVAKVPDFEIREPPAVDDAGLELKFCIAAIPAALLLGILFHLFPLGMFLQRNFFGMPVHELGHATTAWLCGHWAIPIMWKTLWGEERGFVTPLLLCGGLAYLIYLGLKKEEKILVVLGVAGILVQAIGTLYLKQKTAIGMIVFGGDGMGLVIATGLMASFFFGKQTQLYKGSLRWGFVIIGAAAFVDMYSTWLSALGDYGKIPFGEQEGGLLSDATRLVDEHGWEARAMVRRYVGLGAACLVALTGVYAYGVWQAWKALETGKPLDTWAGKK